ncbi:hypothetical protein TNCT_649771 [Trichonephila clavata]|uniref:Uncharacterized protein n=1 Tax=Trichonephila clavata TaxID=2740835 RepID=A0A8X6L026_TRICU|nr:hypothetical protein TNCT_649771 [Trichonephila clavata]
MRMTPDRKVSEGVRALLPSKVLFRLVWEEFLLEIIPSFLTLGEVDRIQVGSKAENTLSLPRFDPPPLTEGLRKEQICFGFGADRSTFVCFVFTRSNTSASCLYSEGNVPQERMRFNLPIPD